MRFVPIKTQVQQTMLSLHRARAGLVKSRTALANQIRGLLSEFGIVLPQGIRLLGKRAIEALSNCEYEHGEQFRTLIQILVEHLREPGNKAAELEGRIGAMHRTDEAGQLLETIPGVGSLTASALAASIDNPRAFRDGRELAAWHEVHRLAGSIHRPVQINPFATNLQVGFVNALRPPCGRAQTVPALDELLRKTPHPTLVVCTSDKPRSAIISTRSRRLSL